jgi:hypothetical protein
MEGEAELDFRIGREMSWTITDGAGGGGEAPKGGDDIKTTESYISDRADAKNWPEFPK